MVSTFQTVQIKQYSAYQMKVIPTGISEFHTDRGLAFQKGHPVL